jgi:hypothetical protein
MLTIQEVKKYVGGQMEMNNPHKDYRYRGEVATIAVKNNELEVTFAWLAKANETLGTWSKVDCFLYRASLQIYSRRSVLPSVDEVGSGELCLSSSIIGEIVILYPPSGNKLDPAEVEGPLPVKT